MLDVFLATLAMAELLVIIILATRKPKSDPLMLNSIDRIEAAVKSEIATNRQENTDSARADRGEITTRLDQASKTQTDALKHFDERLTAALDLVGQRTERIRETVQERLDAIQKDNALKLDQMRATVDEKLTTTLNQRLGETFKVVTDQLEAVHKGLGEMQSLAIGVGDLKKVLSNVSTRGDWGQLGVEKILEDIMTPDQWGKFVPIPKGSQTKVDFAVKLPGPSGDQDECVWLPIDAKFPMDYYQRVLAANDSGDKAAIELARKELDQRVVSDAKDIASKYIHPPETTDLAIMYLPTEGVYAEVLQHPGLMEKLSHEHRVALVGPSTFSAYIYALQMGFRTLAITKRSSEVWVLLETVRREFGTFGTLLQKTKNSLQAASNHLNDVSSKSKTISTKLEQAGRIEGAQPIPLIAAGDQIFDIPFTSDSEDPGDASGDSHGDSHGEDGDEAFESLPAEESPA